MQLWKLLVCREEVVEFPFCCPSRWIAEIRLHRILEVGWATMGMPLDA
jgi:hypothetical protein